MICTNIYIYIYIYIYYSTNDIIDPGFFRWDPGPKACDLRKTSFQSINMLDLADKMSTL